MKHFSEISYKYLNAQKKRSVLTIIGIILSVALFTSIGTLINSYRENEIKNIIETRGNYHMNFKAVKGDKVNKVTSHTNFDKAGVVGIEGNALISKITEEEKKKNPEAPKYRYLNIESYDENALSILPIVMKDGRMPKNKDEIVIEENSLKHLPKDLKIGDKLEVDIVKRYDGGGKEIVNRNFWDSNETIKSVKKRSYTLTGIAKSQFYFSDEISFKAITLPYEENIYDNNKRYNVYAHMKKIDSAYETGMNIARDFKIYDEKPEIFIEYNNKLLTLKGKGLYANVNDSLTLLVVFLVILVVISTILVIYNIFQISVMERITQIGIIRSIGASPEQVRNMVLKEAITLSLIGIPLGIISGLLASKVLVYILSSTSFVSFKGMNMYINAKVIITSFILGAVTIYFSARKPAKLAGKISPLEAVRNTGSIKKEKFKRMRSSFLIRKLFGVEGELAYKNIRRNRRRFTVTVASLVISIVLFIVFNSFMNYTMRSNPSNVDYIFDVQLIKNGTGKNGFEDNYLNKLNSQEFIKKAYKQNITYAPAFIQSNKFNMDYIEKSKRILNTIYNIHGEKYVYSNQTSLYGYDKDFLETTKNHLIEGEINEDEMNKVNGIILVQDPRVYNPAEKKIYKINPTNLKVGDEVILDANHNIMKAYDEEKKFPEIAKSNRFKIVAIADKVPVTINKEDSINFITTEKVYSKAVETEKFDQINVILNENLDRNEALDELKSYISKDKGISMEDFYQRAKRDRQSKLIMSVFLYGFVTIIVLIGSLNILNTINTNLLLRRREFASLKAIGMSQQQVKRQVWMEGLIYGIIAAFWGSIIGSILSYIMYKIFGMMSTFDYKIPWLGMLIGGIGTIIITLLSSYPPLKKINTSNIIETIKMEE